MYPKHAAQEAVEALQLTTHEGLSNEDKYNIQTWVKTKYPYLGIISYGPIAEGFAQAKVDIVTAALATTKLRFQIWNCGGEIKVCDARYR